ncbi:MAG: pyridoxamine 5'-phosphate oxidase family protein [Sporomusaceae bacterium]|nr:pyridoxamine 5'-phosphate oxidase family protein [Sporomusaceae bacterium]
MPQKQLSDSEARDFLIKERSGHLATCTAAGTPYITPLNYMYHQGNIYFHCAHEGLKLDNIRLNNQVCFEVSRVDKAVSGALACQYSTRYTSVLLFGSAHIVADPSRKTELLNLFTERFAEGRSFPPIDNKAASHVTVVEIAVDRMHGKSNVDPE